VTLGLLQPYSSIAPGSNAIHLPWSICDWAFSITGGLCPICDEISQDSWLDGASFFKVYYMLKQLHCPFSNSSGGVSVAENTVKWLIGEVSDSVGFEILAKLSGALDYRITYLFHLWIIFLGTG
jgi:hypothetical protein